MHRQTNSPQAGDLGAAGEEPGGDFEIQFSGIPAARQVWLKLIAKAEERSRNAPIKQRAAHRRLWRYLHTRLARAVLAEADWR